MPTKRSRLSLWVSSEKTPMKQLLDKMKSSVTIAQVDVIFSKTTFATAGIFGAIEFLDKSALYTIMVQIKVLR